MNRVILFVILAVLLPVSLAVQDLLPSVPPSHERIQLLPVVFTFGVLALRIIPGICFTLLAALVQGVALLQIQNDQPELSLMPFVVFFLAWALLFQMASEFTHGMRWELHAAGSALVTLTMLAGEFLLLCVQRGGFPVTPSILLGIGVPSLASFLLAPLFYLSLRFLVPVIVEKPSPPTPEIR